MYRAKVSPPSSPPTRICRTPGTHILNSSSLPLSIPTAKNDQTHTARGNNNRSRNASPASTLARRPARGKDETPRTSERERESEALIVTLEAIASIAGPANRFSSALHTLTHTPYSRRLTRGRSAAVSGGEPARRVGEEAKMWKNGRVERRKLAGKLAEDVQCCARGRGRAYAVTFNEKSMGARRAKIRIRVRSGVRGGMRRGGGCGGVA